MEEQKQKPTLSDAIYLEQLKYLKEINDQQRILSRTESLVKRSFETFQECSNLERRCKSEMEILKNERKKLTDRVKDIDKDLKVLFDLSESLEQEAVLHCSTAPLSEYSSLLEHTNLQRVAGQLPSLKACPEYSELVTYRKGKCTKGRSRTLILPTRDSKASRSHKQCPSCLEQVSRNAKSCPHCKSLCTKKHFSC